LVAPAAERADRVPAASILAHSRQSALVDVPAVDETWTLGTQFQMSRGAGARTRLASTAPSFSYGAAAGVFVEESLQLSAAGALVVVDEAGLRPAIDAVSLGRVQRESWRTLAGEGALGVDARSSALADARFQLALVDVDARFAVQFGESALAVAGFGVASLAGTSPRQSHGAAAFGAKRGTHQVVLALAVHDFGPAGRSPVV